MTEEKEQHILRHRDLAGVCLGHDCGARESGARGICGAQELLEER